MKNIRYIISAFIAICFLNACDDLLDREIVRDPTQDKSNTSFGNAQMRMNGFYTLLPNGFFYLDEMALMASASDEAEQTWENSQIHKFNTGAWGPLDNPDGDAWSRNFTGIRGVSLFLTTLDKIDLDGIKYDLEKKDEYEKSMSDITRWEYEARFLRAFFYFELVKRYGGIPIIDEIYDLDTDFSLVPRRSIEDCVNYIVDECDTVAKYLPTRYLDAGDLGRATSGAALSLKSRVLLYAASDLFNDVSWAGDYSDKELIFMPAGNRDQRWKAAADAAKAVIDLVEARYQLSDSYVNLFKSYTDNEIIFALRYDSSNDFEKFNYPIGYDLGESGTAPSQNLVDAYEMRNGDKFDWDNDEHRTNPFLNRDPRLANTVLLNNTMFQGRHVEAYTGGRDGKGTPKASRTGHYLFKYLDSELDLLQDRKSIHSWILFRLGEIYLNYAEALNEYEPGNPDIRSYLNEVRAREGVSMPGVPFGLSQDDMRDRIRHERRIELAFEDHRFWDVRRWMIAETTLNVPLRGVEIEKQGDNFIYTPIIVENRRFEKKMYLYPIPQNEISVAKWSQNPLW